MDNKTNTLSKVCFSLALGCLMTVGCASAGSTSPAPASRSVGTLLVKGPSVRAVIAGPSTIHAYSQFPGGAIYTTSAAAATDTDCRTAAQRAAAPRAPLAADHVVTVDVGAGQVACLETASRGAYELLWHERDKPAREVVVAHGGDQ